MVKKVISFLTAFAILLTQLDFPAAVYAAEIINDCRIDGDTLLSSSTGSTEYEKETKNDAVNGKSVLDNNRAAGSNNGIITTSETSDNKIGENITYTLNDDGTLTISGTGEMYNYKSDGWTDDVDSPFHCNEKIKSVIIENGVTNIGDSVFHTCKNLERVEIPESVTAINYRAFANCEKLNSITLPDNLTYIGGWAFEKCGGLTDIIIPDSVVTIDKYAFKECNGLTKMTIPAGVKLQYEEPNFNGCIFYECKGLKEVTLYNDRITPSMFHGCDALETVNIEGEVGIINSYAFNNCKRLKKINLPESIYKIDTGAFYGCLSLEEIIIPDNVTVIKQWCFRQCSGLKSIFIPQNVASVERDPFGGCNSLETVFYPYKLDLTNASIPNTATQLPYKIENGEMTITDITLGNEKTEVEICDTVNGIPVVFVKESVRDKVSETGHTHKNDSMGECVICGQKSDFEYRKLGNGGIQITKCYISDRTEVVIPETIEGKDVISIYDFTNSIIEKVTIPKTVKEIYGGTFKNMAKLKEVCFDGFTDGFVTIGPNAFPDMAVKITFPEGLNDNDVRKKMTLTVFPASAKLFSGTEPLPHDYVYVPDGSVHYQKCDACGHVKEDSSEAHAPQGDFITGKPGYNYREYHYQECKCGMEMGFLHEWNDGVEEVEDVKTYTCIVCGATKTETIEHDYVITPDDTGEQHCLKCSDCGKIKPDSYEAHAPEGDFITDNPNYNYEKYHYQKCKCGLIMGILHTPDNGTVTLEPNYDSEGKKEYRCTVCGYLISEETLAPLGHNVEVEWKSDVSGHWQNCECGEKHNFGEHISDGGKVTLAPDYDSEGRKEYRCTICGYLISDETLAPLGHNVEEEWQNDISGHWHNCGCGEKHNLGEHISDGGLVTIQPTYNSSGERVFSCTICGYVMKTETIPPLESDEPDRPNLPVRPGIPNIPSEPDEPNEPNEPDIPSKPDGTTEPDIPIFPDYDVPFLKDDYGKNGWDAIKTEVENSDEGSAITVDMNGTTTVPKDVFAVIKGKDITIVFEIGNGILWSVNGKSITAGTISDIDFSVNADTENIPLEIINNVTKERRFIQISLSHSGEFGFTAVLSINLGKDNAGLYAVLYYYNDDLEYICESEISSDGIAELTFTHASDYLIVIDEKPVNGDNHPDNSETRDPIPPDNSDKTPPSDSSNDSASKEVNPKTGETRAPWKIMFYCSLVTVVGSIFLKNRKRKPE